MTGSSLVIGIGLAVNLMFLAGLLWRVGHWTGKVTTLLAEHQHDLVQHDKRLNTVEIAVGRIKGQLGV